MSTLSSLKLVAARKPSKPSGLVQRRHKLSNKLWEQLQLAQAQATGETYAPTRQRVIKDPETGLRREVTVPKRIRPWWFVATTVRSASVSNTAAGSWSWPKARVRWKSLDPRN